MFTQQICFSKLPRLALSAGMEKGIEEQYPKGYLKKNKIIHSLLKNLLNILDLVESISL